jgi:hypothetical protein
MVINGQGRSRGRCRPHHFQPRPRRSGHAVLQDAVGAVRRKSQVSTPTSAQGLELLLLPQRDRTRLDASRPMPGLHLRVHHAIGSTDLALGRSQRATAEACAHTPWSSGVGPTIASARSQFFGAEAPGLGISIHVFEHLTATATAPAHGHDQNSSPGADKTPSTAQQRAPLSRGLSCKATGPRGRVPCEAAPIASPSGPTSSRHPGPSLSTAGGSNGRR